MTGQLLIVCSLLVFGFAVTALAVPLVRRLAFRHGLVSAPGGRRTHGEPTPLLGGAAIFLPFAFVYIGLFVLGVAGGGHFEKTDGVERLTLFIGTAWILALGTWDDKYPMRWTKKLLGQAGGALVLVLGGHTIAKATLPFVGLVEFGRLGAPLFVIAVVAVTNAVNLVDGIDGLAGGICFFAALTCGIIGVSKGDPFVAMICFTMAGALLGFLLYNFPPASIFMGDGGSMMVGFLLGALATSSSAMYPGQRLGVSVMIIVPFLPFGIPLFEVCLSIARRWLRGQAIFLGDGDHLHYRVRELVGNPRWTVGIFYAFSTALCALTLLLVLAPDSDAARAITKMTTAIVFVGVLTAIGLYGMDTLGMTIRNRPHFKFLGSYLWYMKHRIARAGSVGELLQLLETGVNDLCLDSVEVMFEGRTLGKWTCSERVHPGNVRVAEELAFDGGRLKVRWDRPIHEDQAYNEYLRLTWGRFLAALGPELEHRVDEVQGAFPSTDYKHLQRNLR
jgi:UDP-GlcNAc:undecaprenyl-phosphate GlcNAc-1-phosphate transferase